MSHFATEGWKALLAEAAPRTRGEFRVYECPVRCAEGPVILAVDSADMRHVLLPVPSTVGVQPDNRSSGVHIVGRVLLDGGKKYTFVDVQCLKAHLNELFEHIADEILDGVARIPAKPDSVARSVLHRWRELIERDRPLLLGMEQLAGLWGELFVLRSLVRANSESLTAWRGPSGARFDFQTPAVALEVKTCTSPNRLLVQIHGLDQLEPIERQPLYVKVLAAEAGAATGESVPDLVSDIRSIGIDALAFTTQLHNAGYSDANSSEYGQMRFRLRSERTFRVDDTFPCLTKRSLRGGLPPEISNVAYSLDLTMLRAGVPDRDDADAVLRLLTES